MLAEARARIDGNGDAMSASPGFRFRYRIENENTPLRVSTVTGWDDVQSHQNFRNAKIARDAAAGTVNPYDRVENEVFMVQHAHNDHPALKDLRVAS
jgi:heme-degrading monooxygenase HmoA